MLTIRGSAQRHCEGYTRRDVLRVGALGTLGLTLPDCLRLQAQSPRPDGHNKSAIMVWLGGGPSHIDMYDLKPDAPAEYRGEFKPIKTKVAGLEVGELLPLQAQIADRFTVLRNIKYRGDVEHVPFELLTGVTNTKLMRPSFGSVLSYLRGAGSTLPPYVSLMSDDITRANWENSGYLGLAHSPFLPSGPGLDNMQRHPEITLEQLSTRQGLLQSFDSLRRDLDDPRGTVGSTDAFRARALDMITSRKARDAFDLSLEPDRVRARYGKYTQLLLALRLAQAGVPIITANLPLTNGGLSWDTHESNFRALKQGLPAYDRGVAALITDLFERGLDRDVTVIVWGEMGRTPKANDKQGGRDHWYQSGFAVVAGGGLPMGQVIGQTDDRAGAIKGHAYTPQNVLATLYHQLGIDPKCVTVPDLKGQPQYLLDDAERIKELG